ncbi:hypothetical protein SMICM17S_08004 [Streptomyces microflavus]
MRDRDGHIAGAQLHGVGHREVRVGVGVGYQADAEQLLRQVLADEGGGAHAVDVDAAGGRRGGHGGPQLYGVQPGGGVRQGLLLVEGELGDDLGDRVVHGDVRRDGRRTAGLLVRGEPGQGEAQVPVAGVAEEAGGPDDGRLTGAGELGETGDGEGGASGRIARDGFGDQLHGAGHGGRERPHLRGEGRGGGRGVAAENFLHVLGHI